jgi:aryl-alcohol dehydrogenase-like predicted oxidoreductase
MWPQEVIPPGADAAIDLCCDHDILPGDVKVGLLVWGPLAGGLLSGKCRRTNQTPGDSRRTEFDFPIVDRERTCKILDVMAPIAKTHG